MSSSGHNNPLPSASGTAAGRWEASTRRAPSADSREGYHQEGAATSGGWDAPRWPDEAGAGYTGGDGAVWNAAEDEKLLTTVKENGLDDWTLGDWSEVAAAVGGGKTPEQCFNRWYAEYSRQVASEQQRGQGGYYDSSAGRTGRGVPYAGQHQEQCWPQHPQGAGTAGAAGAVGAAGATGGYPYYPREAAGSRHGIPPPVTSSGQIAFRLNPHSGDGSYGGGGVGGASSYPNPSFVRSFETRGPRVHPELSASGHMYGNGGWQHPCGGARPGWYAGQEQAGSDADEEDA